MKKLLLILLVSPCIIKAQSDHFKASLILGPSFSWMSTDDKNITTESNQLGFKLHLQSEYIFLQKFSLTGGLGLSFIQGGKLGYALGGNLWSETALDIPKGDSLPNGVILGYTVKYLEIPIGFKMTTGAYGRYRFFAQLPEFFLGLRLGARGDIAGQGVSTSDENIKHQVQFLSIGWGLGGGTIYRLRDDLDLMIGVRYQQSITDVTDDSGKYFDGKSQNSKDKINSIDFRIGVVF